MAVMWWMPSNRMASPLMAHPERARLPGRRLCGGLGARARRLPGRRAALRGLALAGRSRLLGRGLALGGPALGAVLEVGDELAQVGDPGRGGLARPRRARGAQGLREVARDPL